MLVEGTVRDEEEEARGDGRDGSSEGCEDGADERLDGLEDDRRGRPADEERLDPVDCDVVVELGAVEDREHGGHERGHEKEEVKSVLDPQRHVKVECV